jgi:hypothetical protein
VLFKLKCNSCTRTFWTYNKNRECKFCNYGILFVVDKIAESNQRVENPPDTIEELEREPLIDLNVVIKE